MRHAGIVQYIYAYIPSFHFVPSCFVASHALSSISADPLESHCLFNSTHTSSLFLSLLSSRLIASSEAFCISCITSHPPGSLLTCALRPSAIFGEGDPLMIPSLVDNARAGKTKFMIGDGKNVCDFTYVENIAYAHVLAAEKLSKAVGGGQAYFVTNDEPRPFWTMMGDILEGLGCVPPSFGSLCSVF